MATRRCDTPTAYGNSSRVHGQSEGIYKISTMGIQSARYITRKEAEEKYIKRLMAKLDVSLLSDADLEDEIDEDFYNYIIT